jgi:integrase
VEEQCAQRTRERKRCNEADCGGMPDHAVEELHTLTGQWKDGRKVLFTCAYTAFHMPVDALARRAQRDKSFGHAFSPHYLRHTCAIRPINVGSDVTINLEVAWS